MAHSPQPTIPVSDPRLGDPLQVPLAPTPTPTPTYNAAPRILNVVDGETVYQRVLLISGRAGHENAKFESRITVATHGFPSISWPVVGSHFKALVHLSSGPNTISLTHYSPDDATPLGSEFLVTYIPLLQNPPIYLAILCATDSKELFDAPPQKANQANLCVAIEKFRTAAYMWQAFTAEQMRRNGFGPRTFRLAEQWQPDTLSTQDAGAMRETAHVYILRHSTLREIRDPLIAQQNPNHDESKPSLFSIFADALNKYGPPFDKPCIVAGLILDTHWDPDMRLVLGHAALGGESGHIRLGIFGSHLLHAWPRHFEEIEHAMMDSTPTDERYVANDANESGEWWRAANIGMGAHLHEVGHALTLSHTPTGIMSRGYNNWNRTFMVKEPNRQGAIPATQHDEAGSHWHRVDIIRLRFHAALRIPSDTTPSVLSTATPNFLAIESGVLVRSPAGLSMLEFWCNGRYEFHHEFLDLPQPTNLPLLFSEISRLQNLRIEATALNQKTSALDNLDTFLASSMITVASLGQCIKSTPAGFGWLGGSQTYQAIFVRPGVPLTNVRIHSGVAFDGIVFQYSDNSEIVFGLRGGGIKNFPLVPGEKVQRIMVRSGGYVDAIEIVTDRRRTSGWCGGEGGGIVDLAPPPGYELVGLYGSGAGWMDQIGIIYRKELRA